MGLADLLTVQNGLEKLRITAFQDEKYEAPLDSFLVMYNPTTFSETRSTQWLTERNVGVNSKEHEYRTNKSDKVTFEFMFDATCASPPSENKTSASAKDAYTLIKNTSPDDPSKRHVCTAINAFFDIAYKVVGEKHKPNYLQINWGQYEFRGVLDSATVNYKLFNSSGLPIRATLSASFSESITKKEAAAAQKASSPDLTHYRIVKEGDTLPLLSQSVYGDSSYYMELAKVNHLTNFRKLEVGQKIILPPIDKKSKSV